MVKYAVKKLPFVIDYVPDKYKTKKMCNKAILENGETLDSVPYQYKIQEICNRTVDNNAYALKIVTD